MARRGPVWHGPSAASRATSRAARKRPCTDSGWAHVSSALLNGVRTDLSFVSSVLYVHSGADSVDALDAASVCLRDALTEDGDERLPPDDDQHGLGRTADAPTEVIVARDLPSLISHARSGSPHADRHTT
jgi:hypothetical protein